MHVFVDESERSGRYLLCALYVAPGDLRPVRRSMLGLCLPGQRRLHLSKEHESRRRLIVDVIARLPVRALMYECTAPPALARPVCLERLVTDALKRSARRLVFESLESVDATDRAQIYRLLSHIDPQQRPTYEHMLPRYEPALWAADAVAWSNSARGDWRRRVEPVTEAHVILHAGQRKTRIPTVRRRPGLTSAS